MRFGGRKISICFFDLSSRTYFSPLFQTLTLGSSHALFFPLFQMVPDVLNKPMIFTE